MTLGAAYETAPAYRALGRRVVRFGCEIALSIDKEQARAFTHVARALLSVVRPNSPRHNVRCAQLTAHDLFPTAQGQPPLRCLNPQLRRPRPCAHLDGRGKNKNVGGPSDGARAVRRCSLGAIAPPLFKSVSPQLTLEPATSRR